MKMQENPATLPLKSERGSAIIWIFIMIFLFGMLSYAMSQGSRTGANTITGEQAKLEASKIIEYGSTLRKAIHELRINGCTDTQISFESTATGTDYENPGSPGTQCHVFHPDGGALKLISVNDAWVTSDSAWRFVANARLEGIGEDEDELRVTLNFLTRELCIKINDSLGIDNPSGEPPIDTVTLSTSQVFQGTYSSASSDILGDNPGTTLTGKQAFCYQDSSNDVYQYTQVLVPR